MILVGSGALLWRAAGHAASVGTPVDVVIHPEGEAVPAWASDLECAGTDDVNELADGIDEICTDGLVCSTGNPFIFREPILELGVTIVNIHGGPLPRYRGLPIAAAVFAILNGEHEFGVTLHRVDAGIDTGDVIDRRAIALTESVTLEELSMEVTQACHDIFVDNIDSLDRSPAPASANHSSAPAGYYGMKQLADIGNYRDHPNFVRATELGVLEDHYPAYRDLFASYRA